MVKKCVLSTVGGGLSSVRVTELRIHIWYRVAKPVGYAGRKGAFTAVGVSRGCPQHFGEGGALGNM